MMQNASLLSRLLEPEFEKLIEILHHNPEPEKTNLIAESVIALVKNDHPKLDNEALLSC